MPILHIDNEHYRYGADQVIDTSRNVAGYMGFMAPATAHDGTVTYDTSFLTYQMPPGPLFKTAQDAENYIFDYIVLNHRRRVDQTGFPVGSRVGNRRTGQTGTVCQSGPAVCMGQRAVELDTGSFEDMPESELVLVP